MITLLTRPDGPFTSRQTVLLDITIKDIEAPPAEARDLFTQAKAQGRKVACIQRHFGGDMYFTYDPASQAQLEISLIAALAPPTVEVHITQQAGGRTKWEKY